MMSKRSKIFVFIALTSVAAFVGISLWPTHSIEVRAESSKKRSAQPKELGEVRWERDLDEGIARARKTGKPIFLLFTEVPGCSTVNRFANGPLSDDLIVEAIETYFVPVAIYNNKGGEDARVLKAFGEPSWNNPVVRIIDSTKTPLAARYAGPYDDASLWRTIRKGLTSSGESVPSWIDLVADEAAAQANGTKKVTLSMYCFWSGEAKLGMQEGVVASHTGHLAGREVVELEFDPRKTSADVIAARARKSGAATGAVARTEEEARITKEVFGDRVIRSSAPLRPSPADDKKQLSRIEWTSVGMTPAQATKVNASFGTGRAWRPFLSPMQQERFEALLRQRTKRSSSK